MKKHSTYYEPYETEYKPQTTQQRDAKLHIVTKKNYDPLLYSKNKKINSVFSEYIPYKSTINPINQSEKEFHYKERKVMSYSPAPYNSREKGVKSYDTNRDVFNYNFLSKFVTRMVKSILKWFSNLDIGQLWR